MSIRVVTLVGARPQFIKASMVSRAFSEAGIEELLIHSGQHYDRRISDIFFEELELPHPHLNLQVGSAAHAVQTAGIMERMESVMEELGDVDWIVVYGDTNTTLAGALVASSCGIRLAHIEAGLRSFNRRMPEEINRIVTDRLSDHLYCPTMTAVKNLELEGLSEGVFFVGDVMYDATLFFSAMAEKKIPLHQLMPHEKDRYYLATVHRASNTDQPERLAGILLGLGRLDAPVVLPLHPRTKARLAGVSLPANLNICEPVGYLQMLQMVQHARAVFTDSGGLQKEAYWLGTPCVTLREETEWVETLENGWNRLVGANADAIEEASRQLPGDEVRRPLFGCPDSGTASSFIAQLISEE